VLISSFVENTAAVNICADLSVAVKESDECSSLIIIIIIIIIHLLYSALKSCKGYGGAGGFRLRLSEQVCFEVFLKVCKV